MIVSAIHTSHDQTTNSNHVTSYLECECRGVIWTLPVLDGPSSEGSRVILNLREREREERERDFNTNLIQSRQVPEHDL